MEGDGDALDFFFIVVVVVVGFGDFEGDFFVFVTMLFSLALPIVIVEMLFFLKKQKCSSPLIPSIDLID